MYRNSLKRVFDVVGASVALATLSPLLGVIAVLIWLDDGGPALFRQPRIGRGGRQFTLFKFRTMPVGTAHVPKAGAQALTVTRVGAYLRRLNLDELPQLVNIVRGDMSLVGPRPAMLSQQTLCALRSTTAAWDCRPGLTGLAQVEAYDGMPETEKARWDETYAEDITLTGDVKILLRTVSYLRRPPPVY